MVSMQPDSIPRMAAFISVLLDRAKHTYKIALGQKCLLVFGMGMNRVDTRLKKSTQFYAALVPYT
jgi:hypothetical protein